MAKKSTVPGGPADSERNSLKQAKPGERKQSIEKRAERSVELNSIRAAPVKQRAPAPKTEPAKDSKPIVPSAQRSMLPPLEAQTDASPQSHPSHVPEHIRRRFVQVGRRYYFPDGVRAFTDRGHRLTTSSENTEVIKSLIDIARTREWGEIIVRGTEHFRREAWFAARTGGIGVRGYRATKFEEEKLARMIGGRDTSERRTAALPDAPLTRTESPGKKEPQLLTGKLLGHGAAPYRHNSKEPMSYFVKIQTDRGERTFWGVDLERAFNESLTQPATGDVIGLSTTRKDAVKVQVTERDAKGQVAGQTSLETHRNRWIVEKQEFFDSRARAAQTLLNPNVAPARAVKNHPELVGTYLQVKAAELAAQKLKHPEDRRAFVDLVRSGLAKIVARGEPLPIVKLKDKAPPRRSARDNEQAQVR